MDYQTMLTALKDAIAADLPARLTAAGLLDFEEYLADTPRKPELRQLGVFLGTGTITMNDNETEILIHATLPRVDSPAEYLGEIIDSIKSISPTVVGKQTLESIEYLPMYAGMPPEGGYGSYIQLSLIYNKQLDDCD